MEITRDASDRKDFDTPDFSKGPKPPQNPGSNSILKSALRLRYLAEVDVLKRDLGSLEEVRIQMGMSRRKICQHLLVDPSAWTRWTKDETKVPPHIWKMLSMMSRQPPLNLQSEFLEREIKTLRFSLQRAEKRFKIGAFLLGFSVFLSGTVIVLFAFM